MTDPCLTPSMFMLLFATTQKYSLHTKGIEELGKGWGHVPLPASSSLCFDLLAPSVG